MSAVILVTLLGGYTLPESDDDGNTTSGNIFNSIFCLENAYLT